MQPPTRSHVRAQCGVLALSQHCHSISLFPPCGTGGATYARLTVQEFPRYETTTLPFCVPDASKAHRQKVLPLPRNRPRGTHVRVRTVQVISRNAAGDRSVPTVLRGSVSHLHTTSAPTSPNQNHVYGGTIGSHSNGHTEKDSGRTYLTPSLRGVKEHEVLSRPETAERTDRCVQMLELGLQELFASSPPSLRLFCHIYPDETWRNGEVGAGTSIRNQRGVRKTEGETRRSPPLRPVW